MFVKIAIGFVSLFITVTCFAQNNSLPLPVDIDSKELAITSQPQFPSINPSQLGEFVLSNDVSKLSGRIAFTATYKGYDRILEADLESRVVRVIIDGPGNNQYPTYSPNGDKIVFVSDRDGNKEIYIADWDGDSQVRLTNNNIDDENPSWSPDGTRITYSSKAEAETTNIMVMDRFGGSNEVLSKLNKARALTPRWSPNGKIIMYSTNRHWPGWDVCGWQISSKKETCYLQGANNFGRGSWSYSGNHIIYSYGLMEELDIGIFDINTSAVDRLTHLPGREYDPIFAPNDRYFAFVAELPNSKGVFELRFSEIGSEKDFSLLKAPASIRFPSWTETRISDLESRRIARLEAAQAAAAKNAAASPVPTLSPPTAVTPKVPIQ